MSVYIESKEAGGKTLTAARRIQGFFVILFLMLSPVTANAQCDGDRLLNNCAPALGSYNYLKSFTSNSKPRKKAANEISYVFSKGSEYIMISCSDKESKGRVVLNLYDTNHTLIASTYEKETGKYFSELIYNCSTAGVYYIGIEYEGQKAGCGLCILGFNRED